WKGVDCEHLVHSAAHTAVGGRDSGRIDAEVEKRRANPTAAGRLQRRIDLRSAGSLEPAHQRAVEEDQIRQGSECRGAAGPRQDRVPAKTNDYFCSFPAAAPTASNTSAGTENDNATVFPVPPNSIDCIIDWIPGFDPVCIFASAMNPRTTSRRLLAAS